MTKEEILRRIGEILGKEVTIQSDSIEFIEKSENGKFTLVDNHNNRIAFFVITPMPGCCGLCISTNAWTKEEYRGRNIGTLMNEYRIQKAIEWGYGAMICTDVAKNEPQNKILYKNNWLNIAQFNNPRTGNDINIHFIDLNEKRNKSTE